VAVKGYDVEINGVGYNLAEDAEGDHYALTGEPLRPPNAVTVQGEQRNRFQVRPDVLMWTLTDWSGGEGQIKYSFQAPHRWRELTGVRVFERPGTLQPGYYVEDTQITAGGGDLAIPGVLMEGGSTLFAMPHGDANDTIRVWDDTNEVWDAGTDLATGGEGAVEFGGGDGTAVYWREHNTGDLWKYNGTTLTKLADTLASSTGAFVYPLGNYAYDYRPHAGQVYEVAKNGTDSAGAGTLIDDFSDDPALAYAEANPSHVMAALDGKLYVMVLYHNATAVREITPTSAAGTGFGHEIARIPGFEGRSLSAHSGTLYLTGRDGSSGHLTVLYLAPGGEYGSLGRVRHETDLGVITSHPAGARMLDHFFVAENGNGSGVHGLWQIDAVSGGMAMLAYVEGSDIDGWPIGPVAHNGDIFWSVQHDATTDRVVRARADQYTINSEAISPWHDFDLADEKILSSLVLSVEAMPANWTVFVDYATGNVDTWTNIITYSTAGGKGTTTAVSTDSSTVKFNTLSIRVRMEYTGAGIPSSAPVVLGVDVRAQVAKQQPVFRLLLDLDDDEGRTPNALSGSKKFTNIKNAADAENVVSFKDGYADRNAVTEYDVVIDQYAMLLSSSGEGFAAVTLREVI
jgi:hypothetical protein